MANQQLLLASGSATIEGGTFTGSYALYISSGTTVLIKGGTFTSNYYNDSSNSCAVNVYGTLTMQGGTINQGQAKNAFKLQGGTATITGGSINATSGYAIYMYDSSGTLTLGTNDSTISTTAPAITSTGNYGIYVYRTLNFYDGVIKGVSSKGAMDASPTNLATGASLSKTTANGLQTCILTK